MDEVDIEVYQATSGTWHYRLYRLGNHDGYRGAVGSGCGSLVTNTWWGRRTAIRVARKAARKYLRKQNQGDQTHRETVTLDGRPSKASLQRRIAELEAELLPRQDST